MIALEYSLKDSEIPKHILGRFLDALEYAKWILKGFLSLGHKVLGEALVWQVWIHCFVCNCVRKLHEEGEQ